MIEGSTLHMEGQTVRRIVTLVLLLTFLIVFSSTARAQVIREHAEIVRILTVVADGFKSSNEFRDNLLVRGHISTRQEVVADFPARNPDGDYDIELHDDTFEYIRRGAERRWVRELSGTVVGKQIGVTDGEGTTYLDVNTVKRFPKGDDDDLWRDRITWPLDEFFYVQRARGYKNVGDAASTVKARLEANDPRYANYHVERLNEKIVLHFNFSADEFVTATVDPQKGFNLVHVSALFHVPQKSHQEYDITVKYEEIEPGQWYPKVAHMVGVGDGVMVEKTLTVDEVSTDVEHFDESFFSSNVIPTPDGTKIVDYNFDPPLKLTTGLPSKSAIDELLHIKLTNPGMMAVSDGQTSRVVPFGPINEPQEDSRNSVWTVTVGIAVGIIGVAAAILLLRRFRAGALLLIIAVGGFSVLISPPINAYADATRKGTVAPMETYLNRENVCGVTCVYAVLKTSGREQTYESLLTEIDIGIYGTNMLELIRTLESYGLRAEGLKTNALSLYQALERHEQDFAIAHLEDHWIAILEAANGNFLIFDYPRKYFTHYSNLDARWRGRAITIFDPHARRTFLPWRTLLALIAMALSVYIFRRYFVSSNS